MDSKPQVTQGKAPRRRAANAAASRPENILLAVLGTTPSVLTETWYAIAKLRRPDPFVPDRVVVITSGKGRRLLKEQLFDTPRVERMCRSNGWPMAFALEDVHVPRDEHGREFEDVRNSREFTAFANTVLRVVRAFTDPERKVPCRIHASIAGGRKTMGYYLGQSMNIFGRPGDTISHIIVKQGYESDDFFYPGQDELLRNGSPADASDIIEMTEFPVVSLAKATNITRLKNADMQFEDILRAIAEEQSGVVLPMECSARRGDAWVKFGATRLALEPAQVVAIYWLAWRARAGQGDAVLVRDGDRYTDRYAAHLRRCFLEYQAAKAWLDRLPGESADTLVDALRQEMAAPGWKNAPADIEHFFRPRLSRCQTALEGALSSAYSIRAEEGVYSAPGGFLTDREFGELGPFMAKAVKRLSRA